MERTQKPRFYQCGCERLHHISWKGHCPTESFGVHKPLGWTMAELDQRYGGDQGWVEITKREARSYDATK